jgi:hypothetical protein
MPWTRIVFTLLPGTDGPFRDDSSKKSALATSMCCDIGSAHFTLCSIGGWLALGGGFGLPFWHVHVVHDARDTMIPMVIAITPIAHSTKVRTSIVYLCQAVQ